MRNKIALAAALLLTGLTVSGCHHHPGYASDHYHHDDRNWR